ncbi:hypothetical protein GWI33_008930 [Rhynchophorus ferrugineus]|uniref:Uncharacterized protein n=1 Tax=Rhynchophorus ferrugineus TaxID=354439 RepID=A0A834MNN3_RHYFE|nr:hypothetical protein GWI33_008930 [Rhynchophorus ferrugineus]
MGLFSNSEIDLIKHIKVWMRKIRDLLDYQEGGLDAIVGKLMKPGALATDTDDKMVKNHKVQLDLYKKANSYAKSMITSSVTDVVYQKIIDK